MIEMLRLKKIISQTVSKKKEGIWNSDPKKVGENAIEDVLVSQNLLFLSSSYVFKLFVILIF